MVQRENNIVFSFPFLVLVLTFLSLVIPSFAQIADLDVDPIAELTGPNHLLQGKEFSVSWNYSGIPDDQLVTVTLEQVSGSASVILNNSTQISQGSITIASGWKLAEWNPELMEENDLEIIVEAGSASDFTPSFEVVDRNLISVSSIDSIIYGGQSYDLTFSVFGNISSVDILLVEDGQTVVNLASDVSVTLGTNVFSWDAYNPDSLISDTWRYKVVSTDPQAEGLSSYFFLAFITPVEDYLVVNEEYDIEWTEEAFDNDVSISLVKQGSVIGSIAKSINHTQVLFPWDVSLFGASSGSGFAFRIEDADDSSIYLLSESFEIEQSNKMIANVSAPEETIFPGRSTTIVWQSTGDIGTVTINLLQDNSQLIQITDSADGNAESFEWSPIDLDGNSPGDGFRYEVVSQPDPNVKGVSDTFSIGEPLSLSIDTPSVEYWYVGGTFDVTWQATGSMGQVTVEIRRTSDSSFAEELFTTSANEESYSLTVTSNMVPEWANDYYLYIQSDQFSDVNSQSNEFAADTGEKNINIENITPETSWKNGDPVIIRWSWSGYVGENVEIILSKGETETIIASSTPNNGSLSWNVDIDDPSSERVYNLTIIPSQFAEEATAVSPYFAIVSECPSGSIGPIDGVCISSIEFSLSSPPETRDCSDSLSIEISSPYSAELFEWSWQVSATPQDSFDFPSSIVNSAESRINNFFQDKNITAIDSGSISIPTDQLVFGFCYTFTLTASYNGAGRTGSSSQDTQICVKPLVGASIDLTDNLEFNPSRPLSIFGSVATRSCSDFEQNQVTSSISVSPFSYRFTANNETLGSSSLSIPKYRAPSSTFEAGVDYQLSMEAFVTNGFDRISSESVDITATSQPLVLIVSGGSRQDVLYSNTITLNASDSYDPDNSPESAQFTWQCISDSCDGIDFSGIQQGAVYEIPGNTLEPNVDYTFQVTYTKGGRSQSDSKVISTFSEPRATVSFNGYESKINPNDPLEITSEIGDRQPETVLEWSVPSDNFDINNSNQVLTPVSSENLLIAANSLSQGETYRFRLTAFTGDKNSSAEAEIEINSPPSGGAINSDPSSGTLYETDFTISTSGFSDTETPLEYAIGYLENVQGKEFFVSLSNGFEYGSSVSSKIPLTGELSLEVRARDALGAIAYQSTSVTINEPSNQQQVVDQASQDLKESIVKGDVRSAVVAFAVVVRSLNTPAINSRYNMDASSRAERIQELSNLVPFSENDSDFASQLVQFLFQLTSETSEINEESQGMSLNALEELVMPDFEEYDTSAGTLSNLFAVQSATTSDRAKQIQNIGSTIAREATRRLVAGARFEVFSEGSLSLMRGVLSTDSLSQGTSVNNTLTNLGLSAGLDASVTGNRNNVAVYGAKFSRNGFKDNPTVDGSLQVTSESMIDIRIEDTDSGESAVSLPLNAPIVFKLAQPGDLNVESTESEVYQYTCVNLNADSSWDNQNCEAEKQGSNIFCSCDTTGTFAVASLSSPVPSPSSSSSASVPSDSAGSGRSGSISGAEIHRPSNVVSLILPLILSVITLYINY